MTYLLAKYTLLFLAASLFGCVLGYWWSRRSMVDVTDSYSSLRKASERSDSAEWKRLWSRMDEIPEAVTPGFKTVNSRIDQLAETVANIPQPTPPRDVDLAPVESRLSEIRQAVDGLPVVKTNPAVDLAPLEHKLSDIRQALNGLPVVKTNPAVDMAPIGARIEKLEQRIAGLPRPESVNLVPIDARLAKLEQRVADISIPEAVSLAPVHGRLDSIDDALRKLGRRLEMKPAKPAVTVATPKAGEPVILSAALYGNKDDLKQISGVGPKLERLLNKNGVYYFWQVAEWSAKDIDFIDDRLDVFRGRIARDNWVDQATRHSRDPGTANRPQH